VNVSFVIRWYEISESNMVGWKMNKQLLSRIFNFAALGILVAYLAGIVIMFITFNAKRFDDDFVFAFVVNYLLWGGVTLLISVLFLMLTKLAITRE
jgi:hypothetical protein